MKTRQPLYGTITCGVVILMVWYFFFNYFFRVGSFTPSLIRFEASCSPVRRTNHSDHKYHWNDVGGLLRAETLLICAICTEIVVLMVLTMWPFFLHGLDLSSCTTRPCTPSISSELSLGALLLGQTIANQSRLYLVSSFVSPKWECGPNKGVKARLGIELIYTTVDRYRVVHYGGGDMFPYFFCSQAPIFNLARGINSKCLPKTVRFFSTINNERKRTPLERYCETKLGLGTFGDTAPQCP